MPFDQRKSDKSAARVRLTLLLVGLVLCVAGPWQVSKWARHLALDAIETRSSNTLNLVVENLRGELAKYRAQPQLLARSELLSKALIRTPDKVTVDELNKELEQVNAISGALDTYLMDATGMTVAASNWASPRPFIGRNFSYRPYFQEAMEGRLGRYYALGTTSGKRGYYFASPVRRGGVVLGVVVVKMRVGHLEAAWVGESHEVAVVDPDGVVFLSSRADWQFRTLGAVPQPRIAALKESRKYSDRMLQPLTIKTEGSGERSGRIFSISTTKVGSSQPERYLRLRRDMPEAGWRVVLFARTKEVEWQAKVAAMLTGLLLASLLLAAANVYQRRRRVADRIAMQETARTDLEHRVVERTAMLTEANDRLSGEIDVRRKAEGELRQAQSELVQATKLAALGQMSAGLSHELNQPLAAIRTYSDNARALLERGEMATVAGNLQGISSLVDRMARIINNLRTYARDESVSVRATVLHVAIESAVNLLEQRIRAENVSIDYDLEEEKIEVMAGEVRLQQVFVNLISNALDAMGDRADKHVVISVESSDEIVTIRVQDNGPGFPEDRVADIFDPFFSTKGIGEGMGLGLSISFGIISQFGGTIEASNLDTGGAVITIKLSDARRPKERAA